MSLGVGEYSGPELTRAPEGSPHFGGWEAVVHFRHQDGTEDVYEIRAYGTSESEARSAAIELLDQERGAFVQSMTPDGPAARRLIEAASHDHDLQQALAALAAAERIDDAEAARFLQVHAVNLYGRTWHSYVRDPLREFVPFSDDDAKLHERIRALRNRYTAHSQSTMTITVPLVDLRRDHGGPVHIERALASTTETQWPEWFTAAFRSMLLRVHSQLRAVMPELTAAVVAELDQGQADALFQRPELIQLDPRSAESWEPGEKRDRFPASRFIPLHMLPNDEQVGG